MLGHVAVGVATARLITPGGQPASLLRKRMVLLACLAVLPDVDFVLYAAAPSIEAFAHRGASHSLLLAEAIGAIIALAIQFRGHGGALWWGLVTGAVVASHGLLDWVGDTNLGVMLFWPFSDARVLAPLHILPNPYWPELLSTHGLMVLGLEAAVFLPLWIYAFFPRRQRFGRPGSPETVVASEPGR
jgi:inner membrane protein